MNSFISFLENLLGTYTPVVNTDGIIPPGMAGVDWPYIFRAIIFVVVLWSLFRILGGLLCRA